MRICQVKARLDSTSRAATGIFSVWPYRAVRIILGAVFIWAGFAKLMNPGEFADLISVYHLVPDRFLAPAAYGLPALEVIAGAGLLFDVRFSLGAVTAMILLFMAVLWFGMLKGLNVDCGCFSRAELAEHDSLRNALHRDFVFLGMAAYLYIWRWIHARSRKGALEPQTRTNQKETEVGETC